MKHDSEARSTLASSARRPLRAVLVAALTLLLAAVAAGPALAQEPIVLEPLTPRSEFTDTVKGQLEVTLDDAAPLTLDMQDLSNTVVARIVVQPGAMFPWHTHPGPVLVTVAEGELVYVLATDCVERPYQAGQAFVDPGRGNVHTAFNRMADELVFYATFLEAPAEGPLTITEGVTEPDCVLEATPAEH